MYQLLDRINNWCESLPDFAERKKGMIWSIFFIAIGFSIPGIMRFDIVSGNEGFFGTDNPVKQVYDRFRDQFGSDDTLYVLYEAVDGDILSEQSLHAIKGFQDEILYAHQHTESPPKIFERVVGVKTIVNSHRYDTSNGSLIRKEFIGSNFPKTEAEREALRRAAADNPSLHLTYITNNPSYGGVLISTDFGQQSPLANDDTLPGRDEADFEYSSETQPAGNENTYKDDNSFKSRQSHTEKALLAAEIEKIMHRYPQLKFFQLGESAVVQYNTQTRTLQYVLEITALLTIALILFMAFRSLSAVVWPVTVITVSSLIAVGLLGWSNAVMTEIVILMVVMIWVLGVADTTHILSIYLRHRSLGVAHTRALKSALRKSGFACCLTTLATAVGMLSLTLIPAPPIQNIGIFSTVGVLVALAISLFVFPLMLNVWNPISRNEQVWSKKHGARLVWLERSLTKISSLAVERPVAVVVIFVGVMSVFAIGLGQLRVDQKMMDYYPKESQIHQAYKLSEQQNFGSTDFEILIHSNDHQVFLDRDVLKAIQQLQQHIATSHADLVTNTYSIVDVVNQINRSLHDDSDVAAELPRSGKALSQLYMLLEIADLKARKQWMDGSYKQSRIKITLLNKSSSRTLELYEDVERSMESQFASLYAKYPDLEIKLTGAEFLKTRLDNTISWSQINSFAVTLVVVSLMLILVFGSARLGLLAIIPILFPIVISFGLMGFLSISLTVDSLLSAPVLIGIAVDDAIHFLTHYKRNIQVHNGEITAAIRQTYLDAGPSILFTSLILASGFLVLLGFPLVHIQVVGAFTAIAVMSALVADLLLLPALIKLFKADLRVGHGAARAIEEESRVSEQKTRVSF